jgi:[ribosomal protein S18]-alanine N-acetyltransferase
MTPAPLLLRRATIADIGAILDIEKSCSTVTWSAAAFHDELAQENNLNFVAEHAGGTMCGFLFAMVAADEVHINTVAVAPQFRRKNIATFLIARAAQEAMRRNAVTMYIEVRSKNAAALALYKKLGFVVRWVRKKYYADNDEDAIVMSKSLTLG